MAWHDYEEEVAAFFRELGWTVVRGESVQGVRDSHKVDVWAMTDQLGVVIRWVVECKNWNKKVSKLHVLALRTIVNDVGADRGVILNEKGFQSGARKSAQSSDVMVSTLADLREKMNGALERARLEAAHRRLAALIVRTHRLTYVAKRTPNSASIRYRPGVRDQTGGTSRLGVVGIAEESTARARAGQMPVTMPVVGADRAAKVDTVEQVVAMATEVIDWMEDWLADQEAGIDAAGGWDQQDA